MSLTLPRGDKSPIVWTIAGSDCAAGAGLQTDLKTITALGAHACTVVTSITAQNTASVAGYETVSPAMLKAQLDALSADLPPQAIKIGMLGDAEGVRSVADKLASLKVYTVYDPVMISTSGARLLSDDSLATMREKLLPQVDLLTPNIAEAEALTGIKIRSDEDVEKAAAAILKLGVKAVFIKGWDLGDGYVQDYFRNSEYSFWLTLPKYTGEVSRGTGCALASAWATAHAFGYDDTDCAVIAKAYVHRCLRTNKKLGQGPPIAEHKPWPSGAVSVARSAEKSRQNMCAEDFPWLTLSAEEGRNRPEFADCGIEPLGFYPVVDSVAWLKRLLPLGVRTAQLRVKNLQGEALENEIREAIALGRRYGARLFINDYWELAIKHKAYGVHLGQEDLATADMNALSKTGLRLGISTHSYAEAARAHALQPSYIALGPIFPTTLKSMKFAPQGVETLRIWRQLLNYPLVAIGGIKLEQADEIYGSGADSIAAVSDVTQNADPEARAKAWLKLTEMRKGFISEGDGLTAFA